ncbi:MAG: S8 family serine peptidase [Ignavibacteriaceae bacterium]|nr:S8 family serine peptidase [Ignavibacteriaceae bacterium]
MNKIIILLIVLGGLTFAQNKYLIYFADKGLPEGSSLNKASLEYSEALNELSTRCIERRQKVMGDDLITVEDLPVSSKYIQTLEQSEIKIVHQLKWFNAVSSYLTGDQLSLLKHFSFIKKVEPVKVFKYKNTDKATFQPQHVLAKTTFGYGQSYTQLETSNIPQVQKLGITGSGVLIGILDSGFRWKINRALKDATVIAEHDFVFNDDNTANETGDISSQDSHGTFVFSVIGGYKDSTLIGSAFGASFLLAKTEDIRSETRIEEDNYAAALEWMENLGVDITTSSLGYNEFDSETDYTYSDMNGKTTIVTKAAELAFSRGVVTVSSAGNEGNNSWGYIIAPADGFNTIAVGAVNGTGNAASFSSHGPTSDGRIKPDIAAMGVSVFGCGTSEIAPFGFQSGTSVAAPIASGAAGLLLSAYPHLLNFQVRDILLRTASNYTTPDNYLGYGIVNAFGAVNFPNIESKNGTSIVHKLIYNENGIVPSSVKIHYTTNNRDFTEAVMSGDEKNKYYYEMPLAATGIKAIFYFTYSDSAGNSVREPSNKSYNFKNGSLLVEESDGKNIPEGFVLAQNYPNPFNSKTRIDFYASANEPAQLIIIDGAGQKVAMVFNGITNIGENSAEWNGRADNGWQCASGVYYYILKMGGKEFGQKMILLK